MGYNAIGIDIVECKPLVELGDMYQMVDEAVNIITSSRNFVKDLVSQYES